MPVRIVPSPDVYIECDECDEVIAGPFALQSQAEAARFAHEESHVGFYPEGEDG